MRVATPVVQAIADPTATSGRAIITIPALVQVDPTNANQNPTSVAIAIDVQPSGGGYQTVVQDTIYGKCISAAQREYPFQLPGAAPWNVRMRRLTPDSDSSNLQNETHLYSLAVVRNYRLAFREVFEYLSFHG